MLTPIPLALLFLLLRSLLALTRLISAARRPLAPPDAVIIMGGCADRERAALRAASGSTPPPPGLDRAAAAALTSPRVPIYVSSPACDVVSVARGLGDGDGSLAARVQLDESAVDTLSNYSSLVPLLRGPHCSRVLILTSASHVRRARLLAWIVLGTRGVTPTVATVRTRARTPPESAARAARDAVRAVIWVVCGFSGASVGRLVHAERFRHTPVRARALGRE